MMAPTGAAAPSPSSSLESARRADENELLVIRCQLGEPAAFDELIRRWEEPLWRYARRLTGHDDAADDVAQDVWVRVLRGIGRLRDGAKLRAWLFGIARRTLMDRLRLKYAAPPASDVDVSALAAADAGTDELEADLAAVQEALLRLPVIERDVLSLFYLDELSLQEVAEVLGVAVGTVKSRLFRARQLLRREMAVEERR
jgi:RNA polymerase sigma-70 factor (ECF subfamily)